MQHTFLQLTTLYHITLTTNAGLHGGLVFLTVFLSALPLSFIAEELVLVSIHPVTCKCIQQQGVAIVTLSSLIPQCSTLDLATRSSGRYYYNTVS